MRRYYSILEENEKFERAAYNITQKNHLLEIEIKRAEEALWEEFPKAVLYNSELTSDSWREYIGTKLKQMRDELAETNRKWKGLLDSKGGTHIVCAAHYTTADRCESFDLLGKDKPNTTMQRACVPEINFVDTLDVPPTTQLQVRNYRLISHKYLRTEHYLYSVYYYKESA